MKVREIAMATFGVSEGRAAELADIIVAEGDGSGFNDMGNCIQHIVDKSLERNYTPQEFGFICFCLGVVAQREQDIKAGRI